MLTVTAPVFVSNDANSVEPESLALFLEETFWCNVPPGTILVDINHTYNHLIMVVEGLLSVCAPHPEHRFTPTRFLGPGAPYNPALLPEDVSPCRVVTLTTSKVVFVPNVVLIAAMSKFAAFNLAYAEYLRHAWYASLTLQGRMVHLNKEEQLLFTLFNVAQGRFEEGSKDVELNFKLPQALLAGYLGISREEISRKVRSLGEKDFLVKTPKGLMVTAAGRDHLYECGMRDRPTAFLFELVSKIPTLKPATPEFPSSAVRQSS